MFRIGDTVCCDGVVGTVLKEIEENSVQVANGTFSYAFPKDEIQPFPILDWPSDASSHNLEFAIETRGAIKVPGWKNDLIIMVQRLEDGDSNVYTTPYPVKEGARVEVFSVPKVQGVEVRDEFKDDLHAPAPEKKLANAEFVKHLPFCTSRSRILALDSAAGGTTRELLAAKFPGKIHVPNPALDELERAIVEQMSLHEYVLSMPPTLQFAALALDACCKFYNLKPIVKRLLRGKNLQLDGTLWITFSVRGIKNPDEHVTSVRDEVMELAADEGYGFACVYSRRYNKIGSLIFATENVKRRKLFSEKGSL